MPFEFSPCSIPSRVMKNIEPSMPAAIRPRNSDPASKVHIRTPVLRPDAAGVLNDAGTAPGGDAVAVGVADGVGVGPHAGQISTGV